VSLLNTCIRVTAVLPILAGTVLSADKHTPQVPAGDNSPAIAEVEDALVTAAKINNTRFDRMIEQGLRESSDQDMNLTTVFFALKKPSVPSDFEVTEPIRTKPLLDAMKGTATGNEFVSIIQKRHIKRLLCVIKDGKGKGIVDLEAPGVFRAEIRFLCRLEKGKLTVCEWSFENPRLRLVLQDNGLWTLAEGRENISWGRH
jgi:hypothetical protein